jgi:glycosyltransferase involved in cell wall biosynthesis
MAIINITIVIPTYNRVYYLIKLLNSLKQTDFDVKVIIIDNGAYISDDIKRAFKSYSFHSYDSVLDIFPNWNRGIEKVETEWFMIPSDDDLFLPDSFSKINNAIQKFREAGIIIFGHNTINENDEIIGVWKPNKTEIFDPPKGFNVFKYGVSARFPGIIFNTQIVKSLGMIDESFVYTAGDSLLIQKCMLYAKSVFINDVLASYRVWANNFTAQRVASLDWLIKVDKWQKEISELAYKEFLITGNTHLNKKNIIDEVIAQNMIVAFHIMNKKENKYTAKKALLKEFRYPFHANFMTQLRLLKKLFT